MNYQTIYDQIIAKAQFENRVKNNGIYFEAHHIIPKCLGGSNDKENLVLLTAREHFLCHWLLYRIYSENYKIGFAFNCMCTLILKKNKFIPSSRAIEESRINFSKLISIKKTGINLSETTKEKMSISHKKRLKNNTHNLIGIKPWNKGKIGIIKHSQSTIDLIITNNTKKSKGKIQVFDLLGNKIGDFFNAVEASKKLNVNVNHISSVILGKRKQTGGYYFERRAA